MKHLYSPLYNVLKNQQASTETDDPTAEFYLQEEATMGSYINSAAGFNGATGSMSRYSFMGKHEAALYGPLYHSIDMTEMDDMPSQAPGQSMAAQAKAAGYQDIFRNIQAMREAEFKKEVKGKEITSEFSGLRPGGLGGGFWFS